MDRIFFADLRSLRRCPEIQGDVPGSVATSAYVATDSGTSQQFPVIRRNVPLCVASSRYGDAIRSDLGAEPQDPLRRLQTKTQRLPILCRISGKWRNFSRQWRDVIPYAAVSRRDGAMYPCLTHSFVVLAQFL